MAVVGMAWHGLLLLLYGFCISGTMPKGLDSVRYETAYACEGKTLKIECRSGESIKLIRANYGRFSITICNDHGNTDWSVNCMSPKTLRVLHNRCSQVQNCSILASTNMFGDPCPGTLKYLEAHFQCMPVSTTTTTNRPSPPWLITSQPPVWSTVKPTARPPPPPPKVSIAPPTKSHSTVSTTIEVNSSSSSPTPDVIEDGEDEDIRSTKSKTVHPEQQSEGVTVVSFTTLSPKSSSIVNSIPSDYLPSPSIFTPNLKEIDRYNYCSPVTLRSIFWNWTRVGDVSIQPCPGGTTGFARWRCKVIESEPTWLPVTPDLSECRSVWLTSLEQRVLVGRDPLTSITSDLAQVTSSKTLYGGDMMITTKIIQNMAQKMSVDIQTFPDHRQREAIVTEMLNDVVRTGSNLLDSTQHPSWRDLSYHEQMRVATSLLIGLEENAFLLADTVIREKTVDQIAKNIMLSVRVLETKNIKSEKFPSDNRWTASNDTIEIPQGALLENSEGGFVRLVFVAFDRLEEILQWLPDHVGVSVSSKNQTKVLNSKIISASLGKGRHIQLHYLVRLTLMHLQIHNVTDPVCVFWDYTTSTWSEEGCHIESTNFTHTVCLCDHLTNFAILANVQPTYYPIGQQMALQIVTYVGCIIAIICLAITLLTFHLFRGIKSDRTTIYFNICVCLLVVELLFVIGVGQTDSELACRIIAAFLHYFFLCTFIWMFFEGFHLYIMLIEVFESQKSRLCFYYLIAYILSLLIVSITGAIFPNGYGTSNYCWLRMDSYFIYTFAGPIVIIVVLNLIFLSMAIIMMCQHASASVSMKNKEHSKLRSIRSWLQGVVILVFLVSLTWVFGFLHLNRDSIAITYLFASLNALQGIFILVFHCIQNDKVRKEYRKLIRQQSWLPKCLRCSKRSSGSGGGNESPTVGKDHRPGVYVGSNGNPASNSHSMDNSVLTPHGSSLSRGWNSRSCNNMNRVGKYPALASTSANVAAALCHSSRPGAATPPPIFEPPNTSTLPYIRNFYKCSTQNPNIPKSTSTWGPLNKPLQWKSISFKSCSRDSGHGGSEQENSPRSHTAVADIRLNNAKEVCRQPFVSNDFVEHGVVSNNEQQQQQCEQHEELVKLSQHGQQRIALPKQAQMIPNTLQQQIGVRKKNGTFLRAASPWNHTYTEIHDCRMQRGLMPEDDPVYEEIEKNEMQVSDMSDEDGKRQSDMSRQSSRSYGDHRPLIPYSPANDRSIHSCFQEAMSKHRSKDHNNRYATDVDHYNRSSRGQSLHKGDTVRSLAAVLDGETVVCHLEPPESYQYDPFVSRTLVLPQYSES